MQLLWNITQLAGLMERLENTSKVLTYAKKEIYKLGFFRQQKEVHLHSMPFKKANFYKKRKGLSAIL